MSDYPIQSQAIFCPYCGYNEDAPKLAEAAPDLLAACKALVAYRDAAGALNFQLEKADDFINAIRAAIAKAEGGEG